RHVRHFDVAPVVDGRWQSLAVGYPQWTVQAVFEEANRVHGRAGHDIGGRAVVIVALQVHQHIGDVVGDDLAACAPGGDVGDSVGHIVEASRATCIGRGVHERVTHD